MTISNPVCVHGVSLAKECEQCASPQPQVTIRSIGVAPQPYRFSDDCPAMQHAVAKAYAALRYVALCEHLDPDFIIRILGAHFTAILERVKQPPGTEGAFIFMREFFDHDGHVEHSMACLRTNEPQEFLDWLDKESAKHLKTLVASGAESGCKVKEPQ